MELNDFIYNNFSEEEEKEIKDSLYLYFFENWEDKGQGLWSALDDQIKSIEDAGQEDSSFKEGYFLYPILINIRKKLVKFIKEGEHE